VNEVTLVPDETESEASGSEASGSEAPASPRSGSIGRIRKTPSGANRATQKWSRIIHAYTSMISLLMVLFFSATGLTLNHPTWTLGAGPSRSEAKGTLPKEWKSGSEVDWLVVSDYLRTEHSVRGDVVEKTADDAQAAITYKGPGYQASAFINPDDGTYDLAVEAQGVLGVMNDLHKGRDTKSSWNWFVDASAIVLIMISLTGLLLQLVLRKRRRSTVLVAFAGAAVLIVLAWITTR
jgi:uncharacterized protein